MQELASSSLDNAIPAPDNLYDGKVTTQPFSVAAGTYVRGEVLEVDTATNKLVKLTTAANAGAIMPFDVTLAADQDLSVYVAGKFNQEAVNLNGATLADVKTALMGRGIFLRNWGVAA